MKILYIPNKGKKKQLKKTKLKTDVNQVLHLTTAEE